MMYRLFCRIAVTIQSVLRSARVSRALVSVPLTSLHAPASNYLGNGHSPRSPRRDAEDSDRDGRAPHFLLLLGFAVYIATLLSSKAQPPPLLQRLANTTLRMPAEPPLSGYGLVDALGDLRFHDPVVITSPPGETNRLFIVERTGAVFVITNLAQPTKTLFLSLTNNLYADYLEAGVLGMAFHPGYVTNRYFFVYRTLFTATEKTLYGLHDQLSRFETSPENPHAGLVASELRLITQADTDQAHNGGDLQFGPDGYLYVALGDAAPPPNERSAHPQAIDKSFFGALLRVDVDKRPGSLSPNPHPASTTNYAIPPDNPFIGATNFNGSAVDPAQVRTELYAVGLRNPWRIAFDSVTGRLYAADVGSGSIEEINVVEKGGNYGWPFYEGVHDGEQKADAPADFANQPPLYGYEHGLAPNQGKCVVGGVVYHGTAIPQLQGAYVFGDFVSGHVWALRHEGTNVNQVTWLASEQELCTFGVDPRNGDVLLAYHKEGVIKRLVYVPPEQAKPFPQTLADTGAFADLSALTPTAGIVPYEVNVPFWSDYANKLRWFSLPDTNLTFGFHREEPWTFPAGTVWIKHFELELEAGVPSSAQRLETRLLVKNEAGLYGVTYRWDSPTNATLVPAYGLDESFLIRESGNIRTQVWHYPSRNECLMCHTPGAGHALAFNTAQLHRDFNYDAQTANQISALNAAGYFHTNVTGLETLHALAHSTNTAYPLAHRVRSYLAANCAQCHFPAGPAKVSWDARFTTPLAQAGIIDGPVIANFNNLTNRIIKPGALIESMLHTRLVNTGGLRMPPIASTESDTNAIALVQEWIASLPLPPWSNRDIGEVGLEGGATIAGNDFHVSSAGAGIGGTADSFHFLYQPLNDNGQIIARVTGLSNPDLLAKAGVMIRGDLDDNAPNAMMLVRPNNTWSFQHRLDSKATIASPPDPFPAWPAWLRLLREGNTLAGFVSTDGSNWVKGGTQLIPLEPQVYVGLAATAHHPTKFLNASFDNVSVLSVSLASPTQNAVFDLPAVIPLLANVTASGTRLAKVEFISGTRKIGEVTGAPYRFVWTNALSDQHVLTAKVTDQNGASVTSQPITITATLPSAVARFVDTDATTAGDWKGKYGSDGFIVVGDAAVATGYATVTPSGQDELIWDDASLHAAALERLTSPNHIAAAWSAPRSFTVDLQMLDGELRRVAFYFLDWDMLNERTQTVEVLTGAMDTLLDRQTVAGFSQGKYLTWTLRGHVKIKVTATGPGSAVLSGVFFDTQLLQTPAVRLSTPIPGSNFTAPQNITLYADVKEGASQVNAVEFFANGDKLGELTNAPYTFVWSNVWAGSYEFKAIVSDDLGMKGTSNPIKLTVGDAPGSAAFLGVDALAQGGWKGRYGAEGYLIMSHATNYPAYAQVDPGNPRVFLAADYVEEAPALQRVNDVYRIAPAWFQDDNLTLDVNLLDGRRHQMALYFLEWQHDTRSLTVEVLDAASEAVLDHQSVTHFSSGKYYLWFLRGHVKLRIARQQGVNVVVSGLFFDGEPAPIVKWKTVQFTAAELAEPALSSDLADPDGDGILNLMEYALGMQPQEANLTAPPFADMVNGYFIVSFTRSKAATDISLQLEMSEDLARWTAADSLLTPLQIIDQGKTETVILRSQTLMSDATQRYFRLKVLRN